MSDTSVGFCLFVVIWNRMQGQTTPVVHLRIAEWLHTCWQRGDNRLLLMAFRSCGKSIIVGLFAVWLLYLNPSLRIIVVAADMALACKMVRNARRILERHPLTENLKPDSPDQWAVDRFTVRRHAEWRDPSMLAYGIEGNITGARADIIICDDVEVPNTCDSYDKRLKLRERLSELSFVQIPHGLTLYVGTPHTEDTIYQIEKSKAGELSEPFLEGFKALRMPLVLPDGQSAWPERFSLDDIAQLRTRVGPRRFLSQMMLEAIPVRMSQLRPAQLQFYDDVPLQYQAPVMIEGQIMTKVTGWWDPAFGIAGGDGSVVAIVYAGADKHFYLHHLAYLRVDKNQPHDEATQQADQVAALCKRFALPRLGIEINGLGRFLPSILRQSLKRASVSTSLVEVANRRPKAVRIMEAFDALLAARALHAHSMVKSTRFIQEMQDWSETAVNNRDDGLDAVAGALSLHTIRQGHSHGQTKAITDFNVME